MLIDFDIPLGWLLFAINFIQDYDIVYGNLESAMGCIVTQFSDKELVEINLFLHSLIESDYSNEKLEDFWFNYSKAGFLPIEGSMRENFTAIADLIEKHRTTPLKCKI